MSFLTGKFPVSSNGRNIGSVTISQEGLLTVFECACAHDGVLASDPGGVKRLAAVCAGQYVPLGVMIPQGNMLLLKKKYSKSALQIMGYQDTDTFTLMTRRELDAAQRAAAEKQAETAPAAAEQKDAAPVKPAPLPAEGAPDTAKDAPAPVQSAPDTTKDAPPAADMAGAPRAQPDAQKAPQGISPPPQSAPPESASEKDGGGGKPAASFAPVPEVKEEKEALNVGSTDDSPAPPQQEKSKSEAAGTDDNTPEKSSDSGKIEQISEHAVEISGGAPEAVTEAGAVSADAAESGRAESNETSLNDGSKLIEALAPALDKLLNALSAQSAPQPEQQDAPITPPEAHDEKGGGAGGYGEGDVVTAGGDGGAEEYGGDDAETLYEGGAPFDGESPLDRPLIGGWRPAPPLTQLFEDPTIYEDHEVIPGALVTEQDGFTLLAVPVSPEEPFALMNIFCFGYPTQIAEKDYILFKIDRGVLAL